MVPVLSSLHIVLACHYTDVVDVTVCRRVKGPSMVFWQDFETIVQYS